MKRETQHSLEMLRKSLDREFQDYQIRWAFQRGYKFAWHPLPDGEAWSTAQERIYALARIT